MTMDVEQELQRLFGDEWLDVAVPVGAEQAIVGGARRIRHRRYAIASAGSVLAIAVVMAGSVALSGIGGGQTVSSAGPADPTAPSTTLIAPTTAPVPAAANAPNVPAAGTGTAHYSAVPTSTVPTSDRPTLPPVAGKLISASGYGGVQLGMSFTDAVSAGFVGGEPVASGLSCTRYALVINQATDGYVWFDANNTLRALVPYQVVHTSDGVSVGWPVEQVHAVYPSVTVPSSDAVARTNIPVPGHADVLYRFGVESGKLRSISIQSAAHPCFE